MSQITETPVIPSFAEAGVSPATEKQERAFVAPSSSLRFARWQRVLDDGRTFVGELETLRERDRGAMAALRRNAGETLEDARGVAWMHGRLYRELRRKNDEMYFLVATLFDWNRKRSIGGGDVGVTMRLLAQEAGEEAIERRFLALLDAEFDDIHDAQDGFKKGGGELAFRLRQMVKLAASSEIGLNWAVLLADLCCWNTPGKPVQKKWARNFYAPNLNITDEDESSTRSANS